ncbi:MAG: coproporphyrinogen dehydrogenase HemZ, partial [Oscillospiraceae bacterium]
MLLRVEGLNTTYEVESFARMVFPGLRRIASEEIIPFGADSIEASVRRCDDDARLTICLHLHGQEETRCETLSAALSDKELARQLSLLLYDAAAVLTGISLRWGVLTGIRPIKLFHALLRTGKKDAEIKEEMRQRYAVQPEMSALALQIARTQQSVCGNIDYRCFSLYVSIPFCPQRCSYCSFVSQAVEHEGSLMGRYVELLCDELIRTGELVHQLGLKLQTIYFGGGTPTTLSATQLAQLFGTIERAFDLSDLLEYTVEAGRPDTIDELKLSVIKAAGVGRISVNPQTMNDHLLEAVGRRHTASDVERAFTLARRIGFQSINMDLIAGLPGDTPEGFAHSLEQVLALSPEN